MNKLSLLFAFISASLFAQTSMTFTGNSYLYVKNQYVFVKNGIDLNPASTNIYLRDSGQLLQGTTTTSTNKGNGTLSVFQEGTVNNFGYNYWCSPIGNASPTVGNEPFGIGMIYRPVTNISSPVAAVISAYGDYDGIANPLKISSRWIYNYLPGSTYSDWDYIGGAATIPAGLGFTMKGSTNVADIIVADATEDSNLSVAGIQTIQNNPGSSQRYDFRGKPNDGSITTPVLAANQTLTGNPYASAINLNYYLLENSGYTVNYLTGAYAAGGPTNIITGNAEYWEQQKSPAPTSHYLNTYIGGNGIYVPNNPSANSPGSYGGATWSTYNPDGSVNTIGALTGSSYKRMFAPIGQGFFVNGFAAGNATMKNVYRVFVRENKTGLAETNSQFERNANATTNVNNWEEIPNVAGVDYTQFSKLDVPQIKIHAIMNDQFSREVTLAFNPNTTDGFDTAMDGISSEVDLPNDAYFTINNTADKVLINTLPFQIDKRIPFSLKAANPANFKISVANIINFTDTENIYLYDGATGLYHDIKNDFYDVSVPAGTHTNRFEVTFLNPTLTNEDFTTNDIKVFQNNSNQFLTISNPKLLDVASVKLYDVAGKQIFSKENLKAKDTYEFSTSTLSDGVYIVKLNTKENKNLSQKVIISNLK
jgi:Secretion system C-terminal sorting domain